MNFTKIVRPGRVDLGYVKCDLFAEISYIDGKLSITGVEGPKPNGNCHGSCGQIDMHEWAMADYAPGWSPELVARFRQMWHQWHLNDCRAGSPAQREWLKTRPDLNTYDKARDALRAAGLSPDPSHIHNGKPYTYGMAWLSEPVPGTVLEALKALPDTDKTPAWV